MDLAARQLHDESRLFGIGLQSRMPVQDFADHADPSLAGAGFTVRQSPQIRPNTCANRAEDGFRVRERNATDKVDLQAIAICRQPQPPHPKSIGSTPALSTYCCAERTVRISRYPASLLLSSHAFVGMA